jgi:hypothetical protein
MEEEKYLFSYLGIKPRALDGIPKACSAERALAIVRVRSSLNGTVRYSSEASACEQLRAFTQPNRPLVW